MIRRRLGRFQTFNHFGMNYLMSSNRSLTGFALRSQRWTLGCLRSGSARRSTISS
jgi:hypothetical protein